MPSRMTDAYRPLFDIASYARRGPGRRDRLSPAEVQQIARTVSRTPEVMVKVLSGGGQDLGAVGRHLDYLGRAGELELETDDGERMQGKGTEKALLEDWDLDLDSDRRQADLSSANGRQLPKLVHKLMFSMPPGTPPEKLQAAVRNLAREQFVLQHRYAFVLHTDEPHPHVHLVLKAVSEQGVRLNIKKATLRLWRSEFSRHLRLLGVAANATERAVRGESRSSRKDGIYRASQRGDSTYMRAQAEAIASDLLKGDIRVDAGKRQLIETRRDVMQGWAQVASALDHGGQGRLASEVRGFVADMAPPRTDSEWIAAGLMEKLRSRSRERTVLR